MAWRAAMNGCTHGGSGMMMHVDGVYETQVTLMSMVNMLQHVVAKMAWFDSILCHGVYGCLQWQQQSVDPHAKWPGHVVDVPALTHHHAAARAIANATGRVPGVWNMPAKGVAMANQPHGKASLDTSPGQSCADPCKVVAKSEHDDTEPIKDKGKHSVNGIDEASYVVGDGDPGGGPEVDWHNCLPVNDPDDMTWYAPFAPKVRFSILAEAKLHTANMQSAGQLAEKHETVKIHDRNPAVKPIKTPGKVPATPSGGQPMDQPRISPVKFVLKRLREFGIDFDFLTGDKQPQVHFIRVQAACGTRGDAAANQLRCALIHVIAN